MSAHSRGSPMKDDLNPKDWGDMVLTDKQVIELANRAWDGDYTEMFAIQPKEDGTCTGIVKITVELMMAGDDVDV